MTEEETKDAHWSTDEVDGDSPLCNGGELAVKGATLMRLVSGDKDGTGAVKEDAPVTTSDGPAGENKSEPSEGADHDVSTNDKTVSSVIIVAKNYAHPHSAEAKIEKGEEPEKEVLLLVVAPMETDNEEGPAAKKQKTEQDATTADEDETFTVLNDEKMEVDVTLKSKENSSEDAQPTLDETQVKVDIDIATPLYTEDTQENKAEPVDEEEDSLDESASKAQNVKDSDNAKSCNPPDAPAVESTSTEDAPSANKGEDESKTVGGIKLVQLVDVSKSNGANPSGACGGGDSVEVAQDENFSGEMKQDVSSNLKEDNTRSNGSVDQPVDAAEQSSSNEREECSGETTKLLKPVRSKHVDPKILALRHRIQGACRDNDLEAAMKAYEEAFSDDVRLEAQSFYNLLNLCDGLERTVHVGTPKTSSNNSTDGSSKAVPVNDNNKIDNKKRQEYAFRLKDHMTTLNLPLNETAYTAIVKVLVRNKDYAKAEDVIDEAESVQQCKARLRLFTPLLTAYCEERQMVNALKCWYRISNKKLELTERELLSLMKCAIATGDAHVFDRVLSEIAEFVAVPSKDTVSGILEWYESPHATVHTDPIRIPMHADESLVQSLLEGINKGDAVEPLQSMGPVQTEKGWNVSSSVPIDTKTGTLKDGCLQGCTLQPVPLSSRAWDEMLTMNESIVLEGQVGGNTSEFQGGRKGKLRSDFDATERKDNWKQFTDFLESMGPIDVVIDSANVGYFKQNFANAPKHVDYDQIDWIARRFLSMGQKVLLILHERHFSSKLMPDSFKPLQEEWERMGILYKTPVGMNDDWFWLHAALRSKCLVLTNDEMRDHHFQMLAPRTFLRWKERHQVHFSFGDWESTATCTATATTTAATTNTQRGRKVELVFPSSYSRRVQRVKDGLVVPLIKRGDENRFLDGKHIAEADEPEDETYLCLRAAAGDEEADARPP